MHLLRRSAALIAAYAVALQLVLSAFAAIAPQAAGTEAGFAICRGDARDAPAEPAAHDPCSACPAHCAGAAAVPERERVTWPAGAVPAAASSSRAAPETAPQAREHSPRAPPLA